MSAKNTGNSHSGILLLKWRFEDIRLIINNFDFIDLKTVEI